jgi:hypothetical protein
MLYRVKGGGRRLGREAGRYGGRHEERKGGKENVRYRGRCGGREGGSLGVHVLYVQAVPHIKNKKTMPALLRARALSLSFLLALSSFPPSL